MSQSKIRPFHDPRITLRSANLNGLTYGYIYCPRDLSAPDRGTIILIHGFPDMAFGWRYQIPFLSSLGLDIIAPDCPGYGRTDAPPHTIADYTYKRVAGDVAELCRQLGLQQVILGGHDWGGAIVYRIAQYYPDLITALFSICTPYYPPTPRYEPLQILVDKRLPNFGYQLHFASGSIEQACQSPTEIRQFLNNMYGARTTDTKREVAFSAETGVDLEKQKRLGKTSLLSDEEMDFYVQEYSRHGLHAPFNWYRNREQNYVDEWQHFFQNGAKVGSAPPTVEQECLFVLAKKDAALSPFMAEKMGKQLVPRLTRREVDANHWALWEKADEVNALVAAWLKEKVFSSSRAAESPAVKSRL